MMRLEIRYFILSLLVFSAARPTFGWNGPGHMTVAKIAYGKLSDREKIAALTILKDHPHYSSYLKKNKPDEALEGEWVFMRAATWPDAIRSHEAWKPEDITPVDPVWYHRPGDHYVNMPIFAKNSTQPFMAKILAQTESHDIICALKQRVAELGLKNASAADRAIALCWLLHLTGDIHQPLHCATLYKEGDFKDGDMGGNKVLLRVGPNKVRVRLHSFWDGLLADTNNSSDEIRDSKAYAEEAYKAASLAAERAARTSAQAPLAESNSELDFKEWAMESHELAQKVAYWEGKIAEIAVPSPHNFSDPLPENVNDEPQGYSEKAKEVAQRRGALAGHRLANTLRHVMK